jgi:iron complex transport system substrate-binding protein
MRPLPALVATAVVAALGLAACSSAATDQDGGGDSGGPFPITIEHAYGTTTITAKPERVATVAWANHEVPLALGIVPVGFPAVTWGDDDGDGVLPWVEERLEQLGAQTPVLFDETDGIDFEAVADTQPDVILAAYSGLSQEEYDTLSQIAPVVAYPDLPWATSLPEMIRLNSMALGLAEEGEQLIKDLDQQIADALARYPQLADKSVMFSWFETTAPLAMAGIVASRGSACAAVSPAWSAVS